MPPKRKFQNLLAGTKSAQKKGKKSTDSSASGTCENGETGTNKVGKTKSNKKADNLVYPKVKKEPLSPELVEETKGMNEAESPNMVLNQLLQNKAKLNQFGSICWKVYMFPSLLGLTSVPKNTQQYFGLDLVEGEHKRTYWTHKASVWKDLFELVLDLAKKGDVLPISEQFKGILACPVRANPNGPNETQTFKTAKGQNIQHWIMLVPMPANIDSSEYIPTFIAKFQALCRQLYIRSAYQSGVKVITQHQGLINQISEQGSYWNAINSATGNNIVFQHNTSLSQVLLDQTIKDIVSFMFGVKKDSSTWSDAVRNYAFGN